MTINFPGPEELRVYYEVTPTGLAALEHVMNINVSVDGTPSPGTAFADMTLGGIPGGTLALDTFTDELVARMLPMFNDTGCTVLRAELWSYAEGTFDATWISTYDISLACIHASAVVACTQTIYTFRTYEGGIMKVNLMEDILTQSAPLIYNNMSAASKTFVDYLLLITGNCYVRGRDTSRPIVFLRVFPGQNEHLFKKRYR